MIVEPEGRKLLLIEDKQEWDRLPKDICAIPVYYRRTPTGIDVWPMWPDHLIYPTIRVSP